MTRRTSAPAPRTRNSARRTAKALLTTLALVLFAASAARANTYYIDYASGSNSNAGTSKAAPWKTHPYMQTGASCTGTGSAPSYTHVSGDQFIFKGGVTWPASCFELNVTAGGTSTAQDYYGVDPTWFTGSSFARPVFDAAQTVLSGDHFFYLGSTSYVTIDNFEMKNQNIGSLNFGAAEAIQAYGSTGVIVKNVYIHDFMTSLEMSDALGSTDYSAGGIIGWVTLLNSTIDDTGGFGYDSVGAKINGGNIGGACQNCREVSNTRFIADVAACFGVTLCHDSEFTGINQNIQDAADPTGYNLHDTPPKYARKHSQAIEDENNVGGFTVFNNWIHDNFAGLNIFVGYKGSQVYNNVLNNNTNNFQILMVESSTGDSSTSRGYLYNNTVDCTGGSGGGIGANQHNGGATITGQIFMQNNIAINCSTSFGATLNNVTQNHNDQMGSSEAVTYGFVAANKYSPASSDPNVAGQALNLSSSCSGSLTALCQDTKGAVWFGGSYVTRPTGSTAWDRGAYEAQGGGGSSGPPTISITGPASGAIVSGSTNLTATCTPQGSATVGSIQFTIDANNFGAAGTSSPFTLSWNTLTAANSAHTISAVCTDSNSQTATAAPVTVTVSNSMPGCFVSGSNTNWNAYQSFTAQTGAFTATFTATPNTNHQDSVIALSQSPISAYAQAAALVRFNSSGQIDVYKGSLGDYTADTVVNYSAGTTYAFTFTVNISAGTYTVALTSPSSVTLATGYTFRTSAPATSLGYIDAVSDNTTPDTAQVCNFQIGSTASLTFSPASLNLGNVTVGASAAQTVTATTSGGAVNFTSVAISGNSDFTIASNACTGSVPISCATQIQFAPTAAAPETATVTYTDAATGSPQTVAVSGTGVPATPTLTVNPTSLNFGGVQLHVTSSSGPIVLTITSGPVTFTGTPALTGTNAADFALASNTCTATVSAGTSCQTVVNFTPSLVAPESATLTYTDTDTATTSPQSIPLTGTGFLAPHAPTAVRSTVN